MVFFISNNRRCSGNFGFEMNGACGMFRCQTLEASFHSFLDLGTVAEKSANPKFKKKFTNTFQNT